MKGIQPGQSPAQLLRATIYSASAYRYESAQQQKSRKVLLPKKHDILLQQAVFQV